MKNNTTESKLIIAALTNSEAYQNYIISKDAPVNVVKAFAKRLKNRFTEGIEERTMEGYNVFIDEACFNDKYDKECGNTYITIVEVNDIVNHFEEKGYKVRHEITRYQILDITNEDGEIESILDPTEVTFIFNWQFHIKQ